LTTKLFRPVGLHELALIWHSGMRKLPPRLPHQPIFCPVATKEYATQIARDWNIRDESTGFAGFVSQFAVPPSYLEGFAPHTVGSSSHADGSSTTSKHHSRHVAESKAPNRRYSLGIVTCGWLFRRNIQINAANSIAGSQIHSSSLCRIANPCGVKKRLTAIGETRIGLHGRK
jgi:hypothetical protein